MSTTPVTWGVPRGARAKDCDLVIDGRRQAGVQAVRMVSSDLRVEGYVVIDPRRSGPMPSALTRTELQCFSENAERLASWCVEACEWRHPGAGVVGLLPLGTSCKLSRYETWNFSGYILAEALV